MKLIKTLVGKDVVFLAILTTLAGSVDWVMMQLCYVDHFMVVLEKWEQSEVSQQSFTVIKQVSENFTYGT